MKLAQTLLEWVATSAALILVVLVLRALLGKRVSACLRYALWAVVLVRLLVPVQLFTSPIAGTWVLSESRIERTVVDVPPAPTLPVNGVTDGALAFPIRGTVPGNVPQAPAAPEPPAAHDLTKTLAWLGWTWLGGSAAAALVLPACNLRFSRKLRRVRLPLEGADCPLPVYVAVGLPSPCLFGVVRPAVYVTPDAAANPILLRHVLAHEITHFRHGDHLWNVLRSIALAIHWWNPLVWAAVVLSRRDCELACDEGALKRLDAGERIAYGRTLLVLVTEKPRASDLFTCATTMTGDQKSVMERINRIARAPKRWLWAAVAVVLVTVLACACAFGQAAEPEDGPEAAPMPAPTESQTVPGSPAPDGGLHDTDLNRNGVTEAVSKEPITPEGGENEIGQRVNVWEDGKLIFSEEGYHVHAGYNAIFLCTLDGEDYLLRYHPTIYQGCCTYNYQLFTLSITGEEQVVREGSVDFDINFHPLMHQNFDPEAIVGFMDEINSLLGSSVQLINTDADLLATFEKEGRLYDSLDWLDIWEPVFTRDPSLSLLDNLRAFERHMTGNVTNQYYSVLLGMSDFTLRVPRWNDEGVTEERSANIADVPDAFDPYDDYMKLWNFAVVDMDGDGADEVLVYACGVAGDMGGYLLLDDWGDGNIRGTVFNAGNHWSNRWFQDLKTDGTFQCSDATGVGWYSVSTLSFQADGVIAKDDLARAESPNHGESFDSFFVNHQEATREEFEAVLAEQDAKPDAVWYDFTPENLVAFPG